MPKNFGHGQASLLTESDFAKIRKQLTNRQHRLFFDLARWTGERWGAICQVQVTDVYADAYRSVPHAYITFRAATRKANPNGTRATRQVPVHPQLKEILEGYKPPLEAYLFPSRQRPGRPITWSTADKFLRSALLRAGLDQKGISTHSTRRSFITNLYLKGVDPATLMQVTGHKDVRSLMKYIELSQDRAQAAISLL